MLGDHVIECFLDQPCGVICPDDQCETKCGSCKCGCDRGTCCRPKEECEGIVKFVFNLYSL